MENKIGNLGLEEFEKAVKTANENLKLAKSFLYLISFWNKRKEYVFDLKVGNYEDTVRLFGNSKTFYSCGSLSFDFHNIHTFLERYEIQFDKKINDFSELNKLKRIVKQLKKLEKDDNNTFWIIAKQFDNLIEA